MKNVFKWVSILMVLTLVSLASALLAQSKPIKPKVPEAREKTPKAAHPKPAQPPLTAVDKTVREVEALEVIQASSYTYVRVKEDKDVYWIAIPKTDINIGDKFAFLDAARMTNFVSKDLKRTFDVIYFVGGIRKEGQEINKTEIVPAGDPVPKTSNHDVEVLKVMQANSYTYLKVKDDKASYWIAIQKRQMDIGDKFSFRNVLRMPDFKSKNLNKVFEEVYFVGRIYTEDATEEVNSKASGGHEKVVIEDISVAPAEEGVSIGELYDKRNEYANKTVRVRGQVTKFSKNIMGMNWVHLQDGTGGAGTSDLTVTTDESAVFGEVVTFEGTIILNKDFGAGYSYELIMQEAKRVE